jgi:hypothetical protein
MRIPFTEVVWTEDWDFPRIVRESGYAHEVDIEDLTDKIWGGGTRELILYGYIDSETGQITVTRSDG